ncbi:MAG: sirohydrochlorin chelatase [Culicoidibacterales bacterium]
MNKKGIIIVGHGSRAKDNNVHFFQLCELMKNKTSHPLVGALLDFSDQTIQEGTRQLIDLGCTHIIAIPFLLYGGIHLTKHIPQYIEEITVNSTVTYEVTSSLGTHPLILEALTQKITDIED